MLESTIFPSSKTAAPPLAHLIKTSTANVAEMAAGTAGSAPLRHEPAIARYRRALKAQAAQAS
jgi:hypothetical protein